MKYGQIYGIIFLFLLFFPIALNSIKFNIEKGKPDIRTFAKSWIEKNISSDQFIILEGTNITASKMTVPLKINPALIEKYLKNELKSDLKKAKYYSTLKKTLENKKTYNLIFVDNKRELSTALKQNKFNYVILRQNFILLFNNKNNQKHFPELYKLVRLVNSHEFKVVKIFKPDRNYTGHKIIIFKRISENN